MKRWIYVCLVLSLFFACLTATTTEVFAQQDEKSQELTASLMGKSGFPLPVFHFIAPQDVSYDISGAAVMRLELYISDPSLLEGVNFMLELTSSSYPDTQESNRPIPLLNAGLRSLGDGWYELNVPMSAFMPIATDNACDYTRMNCIRMYCMDMIDCGDETLVIKLRHVSFASVASSEVIGDVAVIPMHLQAKSGDGGWRVTGTTVLRPIEYNVIEATPIIDPGSADSYLFFDGDTAVGSWLLDDASLASGDACLTYTFGVVEQAAADGTVSQKYNHSAILSLPFSHDGGSAVNAMAMDALEFDLYLSCTPAELTALDFAVAGVELSSSGMADVDELEWTLQDILDGIVGEAQVGWNRVRLPFDRGVKRGGAIDLSAVNYLRLYMATAANVSEQTRVTVKIDHFRFTRSEGGDVVSAYPPMSEQPITTKVSRHLTGKSDYRDFFITANLKTKENISRAKYLHMELNISEPTLLEDVSFGIALSSNHKNAYVLLPSLFDFVVRQEDGRYSLLIPLDAFEGNSFDWTAFNRFLFYLPPGQHVECGDQRLTIGINHVSFAKDASLRATSDLVVVSAANGASWRSDEARTMQITHDGQILCVNPVYPFIDEQPRTTVLTGSVSGKQYLGSIWYQFRTIYQTVKSYDISHATMMYIDLNSSDEKLLKDVPFSIVLRSKERQLDHQSIAHLSSLFPYIVATDDDQMRYSLLIPLSEFQSEALYDSSALKEILIFNSSEFDCGDAELTLTLSSVGFYDDTGSPSWDEIVSMPMNRDVWSDYMRDTIFLLEDGSHMYVTPTSYDYDLPDGDEHTVYIHGGHAGIGDWLCSRVKPTGGRRCLEYRFGEMIELLEDGSMQTTVMRGAPLVIKVGSANGWIGGTDAGRMDALEFDLYLSCSPEELAALQLGRVGAMMHSTDGRGGSISWTFADIADMCVGTVVTGWYRVRLPIGAGVLSGNTTLGSVTTVAIYLQDAANVDAATDVVLRIDNVRLTCVKADPSLLQTRMYILPDGSAQLESEINLATWEQDIPNELWTAADRIPLFGCNLSLGAWTVDAQHKTLGKFSLSYTFGAFEDGEVNTGSILSIPLVNVGGPSVVDLTTVDALEFDLYISDVEAYAALNVAASAVELCSAAGWDDGALSWSFAQMNRAVAGDLQNGWNHIRLPISKGLDKGIDQTAATEFRIYFVNAQNITDDTSVTLKVDNFYLSKSAEDATNSDPSSQGGSGNADEDPARSEEELPDIGTVNEQDTLSPVERNADRTPDAKQNRGGVIIIVVAVVLACAVGAGVMTVLILRKRGRGMGA